MYQPAPALHMLSFENFVKSMPPSLSELKVTPSFCFAFKIPDDRVVTNKYHETLLFRDISEKYFTPVHEIKDSLLERISMHFVVWLDII